LNRVKFTTIYLKFKRLELVILNSTDLNSSNSEKKMNPGIVIEFLGRKPQKWMSN
jgi:hypothetical protein